MHAATRITLQRIILSKNKCQYQELILEESMYSTWNDKILEIGDRLVVAQLQDGRGLMWNGCGYRSATWDPCADRAAPDFDCGGYKNLCNEIA